MPSDTGAHQPVEAGVDHALPSTSRQRAQADLWFDRMWGDQQGFAQTALRDRRPGSGKPFEARAYRWPAQRDELPEALLAAALSLDVYVGVLLRDRPSRKSSRSSPLPGRYAWVDADPWGPEQVQLAASLPAATLMVESGAPGHLHLYVDLGELRPGAEVAELSRQLTDRFGCDDFGGDNKLLRLPGTFNHKYVERGQPPLPVRWRT